MIEIDIDAYEVIEKPRRQQGQLFFTYWLSQGKILKCPVGPMWWRGPDGKFAARPDDVEHNRRLIKEAIQRAQEAVRKRVEPEAAQVQEIKRKAVLRPPRLPFVRPAVVAPSAPVASAPAVRRAPPPPPRPPMKKSVGGNSGKLA